MAQLVPSYAQQQFRIAAEDSYNSLPAVPVWRRMNSMRANLQASIETETFASSGDSVPSIVNINDDYGMASIEGKVDYETIHYILSSLFGETTPTTPGGGTNSRRWAWNWTGRDIITPKSYAVSIGAASYAEQMGGAIFNGLGINGNREGMDLDSEMWGQAIETGVELGGRTSATYAITITGTPTGGGFKLRHGITDSATINFDDTGTEAATAVENLLLALGSNIEVAGSGGPLPDDPVILTFTNGDPGLLIIRDVTLTGGSSPAVTYTVEDVAVDAATDITPKPMFPLHGSVYFDTTWAGLGTTQLKHAYDMDLSVGEKYERTRPINRSRDSDSYVEIADQDHTLELTLAVDYRQRKILEDVRTGDMRFFRYEAVGPIIEGAIPYDLFIDLSLFIEEVGEGDENNNIYVRPFTFRVGRDATSGNAAAARVTNTRTAY